jgi:hypothetical protein
LTDDDDALAFPETGREELRDDDFAGDDLVRK